jgi:D-alanyl-lipoteichoic acid acyltransferase DltB (MBOAT superfamily)
MLVWLFGLLGLLPLLVFKYYNFLNNSISAGLSTVGLLFSLPGLNWAIPVGISFFTFQAVGYLLDVYYGRVKAENNLLDYLLFVSFFPQVMSGPISKADELLPQIKGSHSFDYEQARKGLQYLLWGMFLKVVVADRIGVYVDTVYANYHYYNGITCFLASVFYSFQIYTDFAGYSLMSISLARLLGFNLINNFRQPYFSVGITDFWRRWHISLSRWLKDYVYIPLGGSRCSKLRCYCNILVTFLVSGIWHGANWTFILWGLLHGLSQVIEKSLGWVKKGDTRIVDIPKILITFLIVNFLWILFRCSDIGQFLGIIKQMTCSPSEGDFLHDSLGIIMTVIMVVVAFDILKELRLVRKILSYNNIVRWCIYVIFFVIIIGYGVLDSNQFIYVSF